MSNVNEPTELSVRETFKVHPLTLCHHATMIVGLLHLNEAKRQTIDKQGYVGAEFILAIFASKLSREMKRVVQWIIKNCLVSYSLR